MMRIAGRLTSLVAAMGLTLFAAYVLVASSEAREQFERDRLEGGVCLCFFVLTAEVHPYVPPPPLELLRPRVVQAPRIVCPAETEGAPADCVMLPERRS